jgi:hypothetical protein
MIAEVAKFASVMGVLVLGWATALHAILQEDANTPQQIAAATKKGLAWPNDYGLLTKAIKTLLRAIFGDFSGAPAAFLLHLFFFG